MFFASISSALASMREMFRFLNLLQFNIPDCSAIAGVASIEDRQTNQAAVTTGNRAAPRGRM
jgi:hypothetical protein